MKARRVFITVIFLFIWPLLLLWCVAIGLILGLAMAFAHVRDCYTYGANPLDPKFWRLDE